MSSERNRATSSAAASYGKECGSADVLHVRSKNDWHTLCSEFNLCKRKLEAKKEALLILAKELDMVRQEKDAYQLMAEQLREKFQAQRRKYEERERSLGLSLNESDPLSERRNHNHEEAIEQCTERGLEFISSPLSLIQILCEAREQNKKSEAEIADLHQKLAEAHGDIKLLRENIARQRVGDDDFGARHFPAHEREELVKQLEEVKEQLETLQRDMVAKIDEQEEVVTERDFFRDKSDRLNQELNYVLGGDERRIVDIDALIMENKYLKERLKQCQEEKAMAQSAVNKYKNALEKRRGRGGLKLGATTSGGLVISQTQVEKLLSEGKACSYAATQSSISDLRSLATTLLETVHDKNMALNHQRNTNKILGSRVAELEKKLKTLEIAGLWNLPPGTDNNITACCMVARGGRSSFADLEKQRMQAGITSLIPRQVSIDASDVSSNRSDGVGELSGLSSISSSTHTSPDRKKVAQSSPAHKTTNVQDDVSILISLNEDNAKQSQEESITPKSSPGRQLEKTSSHDVDEDDAPASITKVGDLLRSNLSDLVGSEPDKKDLLGDCNEEQFLSTKLDISPERCKSENIVQPHAEAKVEEKFIPSVVEPKLTSTEDVNAIKEDDRLVVPENNRPLDSHLLQFEESIIETGKECKEGELVFTEDQFGPHMLKLDNSSGEEVTQSENKEIERHIADAQNLYVEKDNLQKISAVMDKANEQQELDVYIVDIQDDEDELEEDEESDNGRFDQEEVPFLASTDSPMSLDANIDAKDIAQFEGFFEGVSDRIATKNLEKAMGVSLTPDAMNLAEEKAGAEGQQHTASAASPLIPKEKRQKLLSMPSLEEADSLSQCV